MFKTWTRLDEFEDQYRGHYCLFDGMPFDLTFDDEWGGEDSDDGWMPGPWDYVMHGFDELEAMYDDYEDEYGEEYDDLYDLGWYGDI
jgi:hypothetical protein